LCDYSKNSLKNIPRCPFSPSLSAQRTFFSRTLDESLFTESVESDRKVVSRAASIPHHLPLFSSMQLPIKTHDKLAKVNSTGLHFTLREMTVLFVNLIHTIFYSPFFVMPLVMVPFHTSSPQHLKGKQTNNKQTKKTSKVSSSC